MRGRLILGLLLGLFALAPPSGWAQRSPSCELDAQCWNDLARGRRLAEAGEYSPALSSFEQAYQRVPDPRLQINIGRSLYHLQRYDEAVAAFKRYQATASPAAPLQEQEVVRRFIAEAQLAKLQSTSSLAPPPAPATHAPVYKKWWFWTLLGAGVAGAVVAGVVVGTWPRTPSEDQAERIRFGLSLAY